MKKTDLLRLICILSLISVLAGCRKDPVKPKFNSPSANSFPADVANQWLDLERDMVWTTAGFTPPVVARAFAYSSLSLYEAILPGMPENKSLMAQLDAAPALPSVNTDLEYYWPAAANAAFAESMRGLFKSALNVRIQRIDSLENAINSQLAAGVNGEVMARSQAYGKKVAAAIYEWSKTDGGDEAYLKNFPASYIPPSGDGMWEKTGPNPALQPYWGKNRPFRKESLTQAAMAPPHPFSTEPSSDFYKEARETYLAVKNATPEQTEVARFWSCDPGSSSTPAGHSFSIMSQILNKKNASLALAAEAYARLGVALNDAFICCWAEKYKYTLIRPVTYINRYIDAGWHPILNTPPFPEYASGHSVESAASATIMAGLFGDEFSFDDHTNDSKGMKARHFDRFSDFAKEAGISRVYGGIHFRKAMTEGLKEGNRIGQIYAGIRLK